MLYVLSCSLWGWGKYLGLHEAKNQDDTMRQLMTPSESQVEINDYSTIKGKRRANQERRHNPPLVQMVDDIEIRFRQKSDPIDANAQRLGNVHQKRCK